MMAGQGSFGLPVGPDAGHAMHDLRVVRDADRLLTTPLPLGLSDIAITILDVVARVACDLVPTTPRVDHDLADKAVGPTSGGHLAAA